MKLIAIGLVVIVIGAAFYITDRKVIQQKTVHAADSLDSISSGLLHYSVDSVIRAHDRYYNARLSQLELRLRFQNSMIYKLSERIDRLDSSVHVHSEIMKHPFGKPSK